MLAVTRLIFAIVLFLVSLLVFIPALNDVMWKATVIATEFGHYFAFAGLLLLLPGRGKTTTSLASFVLIAASIVLFVSPLARALPIASRLPGELYKALPVSHESQVIADIVPRPLGVRRLVMGQHARVSVSEVTYMHRLSGPQAMDIYSPGSATARGIVILFVHGGAWKAGSRRQAANIGHFLASRGYPVASMSYRFAPEHPFPAAVEDVKAAIDYLRQKYRGSRVVLIGRSAGAHLALLAAYTSGHGTVGGVVSLYAPADLAYSYANPAIKAVIDTQGVLEDFLGGPPQDQAGLYRHASPLHHARHGNPPTMIIHGGRDDLVSDRHSIWLAERLASSGVTHFLLRLPWATHAFDFNIHGPGGQLSLYAIEHFLRFVSDTTGKAI